MSDAARAPYPTNISGRNDRNEHVDDRKNKKGKLFTDMCEGLPEKRLRGKTLMYEFNHSHPSEFEKRESLIKEMFATVGENARVDPPSISLTVPTSI